MKRLGSLLVVLLFTAGVFADDWAGKTITVKESVKLGRKLGNGIIRDGAALDPAKSYVVKADDGTFLELAGGHIFKFEAALAAVQEKPFPKTRAKDTDPIAAKGEWFGKKVLPKRDSDTIRMGDYEDDKPVSWTPHNLLNCTVREDRDGYLRVYDMRREGWVLKDDMVTAEDAPAWWDKAVKEKPNDYYGWWMRGMGWCDKGEYDNAIKDLTEAIRLKPDSNSSYNSRGKAWGDKKEYDKAIADYDEAIRLDPKGATAYVNRGSAWRDKKEYDKAIADYDEAIRLDPKDANAHNNRGYVWSDKKEYDKAIADYDQAILLDPKNSYALGNRAFAYAKLKKYDDAVVGYEKLLELYPNSELALNALCWKRATCPKESIRDGKKAVEYGKKLVELKAADWRYHDSLSAAHAEAGDFELAVAEQRKAVEMLKATKDFDKDDLTKAEARLELYRAKKPYRDVE